MNNLQNELVTIKVRRSVAQKLKIKAILAGLTREQYLEKVANQK